MNRFARLLAASGLLAALLASLAAAQPDGAPRRPPKGQAADCVECHRRTTPGIVTDWEQSAHSRHEVGCDACHGTAHATDQDADKAAMATPDTCRQCHEPQVAQYMQGKHALAWTSVNAMPTTHYQPMVLLQGQEGCTACHRVGVKDEKTIKELRDKGYSFGVAACDSCHTRHLFSKQEARSPQACRTCHMGFDHPQWEMYESSKHGVRHQLKQSGVLPKEALAPTCQTCHMPGGSHANITAWGFLAVRLPLPEDKAWADDRTVILKGLGVLSPEGKPTDRLEAVKAANVARLDQQSWQTLRDRMLGVCAQCHSENFARQELEKGDAMIRESDRLMARGVNRVAELYQTGALRKPKTYAFAYPDLLTFHDAPTRVEQELFLMFLEHRMRTFQGSFHQNPDYALWYGWSAMLRSLTTIEEEAGRLAATAKPGK